MAFSRVAVSVLLFVFGACANSASVPVLGVNNSGTTTPVPAKVTIEGNNVMPLSVNGSLCSKDSYPNKPCTSITVCVPGTQNCQTINDILVDTGSYGLRVFSSVLTLPLSQVTVGGVELAECVAFGDGSTDWGPVKMASIVMGNEPAVSVPIQVIDSTYATPPSSCQNSDTGPEDAGFNGILGIGLFVQDCGQGCVNVRNNNLYFACTGSSCTGSKVPLNQQVSNPVAALPVDNNGVILVLPSISAGVQPSTEGSVVFGIGTQSNNIPSGVTVFKADSTGEFTTSFDGYTYNSFIDSGTNALLLPSASSLTDCPGGLSGWFCPTSTVSLTAANTGYSSTQSVAVTFKIANAQSLFTAATYANFTGFSLLELGASSGVLSSSTSYVDWGLPFYFGRKVYSGIDRTVSSLGTGPYWAY